MHTDSPPAIWVGRGLYALIPFSMDIALITCTCLTKAHVQGSVDENEGGGDVTPRRQVQTGRRSRWSQPSLWPRQSATVDLLERSY